MNYLNTKKGFTLIELIIVVVIIAVLATLGLSSYNRIQDQSRATKIVNDFKAMEKAWKSWKAGTNFYKYPHEDQQLELDSDPSNDNNDRFNQEMNDLGCTGIDEPEMSKSPIVWSNEGYLDGTLYDPWGREYVYDYDNDPHTSSALFGGVNVMVPYCSATNAGEQARYQRLVPIIDNMIDGGDGNAFGGKFFYDTGANGELWYNISIDGT